MINADFIERISLFMKKGWGRGEKDFALILAHERKNVYLRGSDGATCHRHVKNQTYD